MKKFLIAANWKMNPQSLSKAKQLFLSLARGAKNIKKAEIVLCPPFVYLPQLAGLGGRGKLTFGSQNCFWEEKGAFTGEISVSMLKDLGCRYVIVGHSERRGYFGETGEVLNKKTKAVLASGLKAIFCVGETPEEKEGGRTKDILKLQIEEGLAGVPEEKIKDIIIAYEPVFAIGSGKACPPSELKAIVAIIKEILSRPYGDNVSQKIRVLYGGSVNSQNASDYIKDVGIDGLLVGGASLDAKEFLKILKCAEF